MSKFLLSFTFIFIGLLAGAQSFSVTYNFASTTTLTGVTDPTTPPTASGLTFGAFTAVGTSTANQGTGRFSYNGWPIATLSGSTSATTYTDMGGALDPSKYYEVTLTPVSGNQVTLTSMDFTARRTGTAPRSFAVRSSVDSYVSNLTASVTTGTVITTPVNNEFWFSVDGNTSYFPGNEITFGSSFVDLTSPVTIRIYAWNSEATLGNFTIDDVTFNGSVSVATSIGKVKFDLNSNFTIYPVPSHDGVVFIDNKNTLDVSKIEVIDVLGNVVLTSNSKNDIKIKLNLADMPNGNYFVRMHSGNTVSTKKIVIIK